MTTTKFLRSVLGELGHYCIVAIKGTKRIQTFYSTIESAIEAAIKADTDGFDAYYGLATFKTDQSRTNDNVEQLRSFFLDLDCGATKDYPDQQAALNDLRRFCKELNLPRPTLVNSGRGIHVYWPLTEPVSRETWLPVSTRLKALCKDHNLLADVSVTADSARILRVPGTHNYKDDQPKPVELVGHEAPSVTFEAFKDLLGTDPFANTSKFVPQGTSAVAEALMGNYASRFKTIMIKTANGGGCEQLKIAATQQDSISEPQWRAALSVAAFCIDAPMAIHKISERHHDYSEHETEKKAGMIKGPYTCAKFDEYNEGVCPNCPHWGKIKSPIVLGREVLEATAEDNVVNAPAEFTEEAINADGVVTAVPYVIPQLPRPYFRGKDGGVYKRNRTEEGDVDVMVYHHDLYVVKRMRDPELGESVVMRLHLPHDGIREFSVALTAVASKDEFKKSLAMHGVAMLKTDELMAYVTQWVNELQMRTVAEEARRQFGWTEKMDSFVLGDREYYADREVHNPVSSATREIYTAFKPKGSLDGWKEMMNFYNRPGFEAYQWVVGTSFGSPLMAFTPINAAGFHLHSKDSGLGKTTTMFAAMSVWGDGERLVLQERDTYNARMNRAEVMKNLPLYMDEITNMIPKDASDLIYQLNSGMQRNRMGGKGNAERYRGAPWSFIWVGTGNTDIIERVSLYKSMPKAEAMRVLSHKATKINFDTKYETDRFSVAIKDNYGWAGPIYIQHVIQNREKVLKLLDDTQRKIDEAAGLSAEHRFWSVEAACNLTGLLIAKRLKLIDYDLAALFKWVVKMLRKAKDRATEMNDDPLTILGDYMAENVNNMLRIKSTADARKKGVEEMVQPESSPRGYLVGRYEYDLKKMYLVVKPFREWCVKHQTNYQSVYDGLKATNGAKKDKCRLGKGTHINIPPVDVIVMDFDFDELIGVEDGTPDQLEVKS